METYEEIMTAAKAAVEEMEATIVLLGEVRLANLAWMRVRITIEGMELVNIE